MPPSELDVRASLFTLLSTRRDIDILVFELLGRYNVDRLTGSQIPEHADRLNFGLACQLAFIFDLQRTHLQSRTPFGGGDTSSITERLPYLLSFQAAKGAFECVSQLARDFIQRFDGHQGIDVSSKRNVFLRALVSGARMLCLHPGVRPGETVVPAPFEEGEFSFWESTLTEVCNAALSKVPERHPGLQLPRMGRQMFPMDDSRLMKVTKECTTDILSNSAYKYWTLYDISCSVVTAYIQHREIANSEDADILDENAELLLGLLAAGIADSAAAEALRVYKTAGRGERCAVMLMDIVEVLNPILMEHPCEPCSTGYETITRHPRYSDHSSIYEVQDPCKIPTLKKFQEVLNQRGLVLRDSDNELPTLLSKMDRVCSEIANTHVRPSNRPGGFSDDGGRITEILEHTPISPTGYSGGDNRPMETLRLYAANCESTHIIAHSPTISAMVEDAEDQRQTWNDGSLTIPSGAICPFCPNSPHPKLIHNLREISPLNQVLGVAIQKRQNLEQLRRSRETRFMQGMASPITIFRSSVPEVGLHPVPRQHHNSYIPDIPEVVEPLGEQRNTTTVSIDDLPKPVGASGWKRFKNTIRIGKKSDTASTVSGSLMNGNSSMGHIDLLHLQNKASGDVNVTLSFDCERLVTWNNTNLALHDVSGREAIRLLMLGVSPVKDPDIILASRSYCAIVRRGPSHDEASIPSKQE
ncbi:MAG: hypothetical protein M1840_006952 [Geoglossum simile]|nr:MAG: hypothetical protein M1840_006952 [Geoglossum simile]